MPESFLSLSTFHKALNCAWVRERDESYLRTIQGCRKLKYSSPCRGLLARYVAWLGLPAIAGILLILGVVRKEFILLASVAVFGSTNLALFLTPVQLITLALIGMLYLPCLSTIAVLAKEFGWKTAATISMANFATAMIAGGVVSRLLSFVL